MQTEIRPPQDITDQELLQAFIEQASDSHFTALVRRHAPWIFAAGYRQLKDRHLAEDATQMVFIALLQRAGKLRRHPTLVGWLFSTLNYTVENMRRIERRRKVREHQAAAQQNECESSHSPMTIGLANELDQAVAKNI
jgi:DNA-directed RNA polymerase specialized sigma24 family protein